MAKIILKRSSVAAKVPLATDLEVGELAVNLSDKKLFTKDGGGTVVEIGGAVSSVAGKTGVVTLVKGDVGLGNVDNTADSAKSVASAATLTTARTISLTGDVTGSTSFNGSSNVSITATVADDSHNHVISNVDGLQTALDGKQPLDADLTAIAALAGTSGLLKKTAANTWALDTTAYTTNTGTVTSVGGTGGYGGLTLSGTVTTSGNLTLGGTPTGTWPISVSGSSASTTGNAATATALQTARTINGVSFNGTANITITAAANGGNADTVDSLHASSFFRRDTSNSVDVRLASGDGRGVRFWDSNSYKIWMSSAANATWGGRISGDATSDYNIYFRIASGTNRGFVFESAYATKLFAINPDGVRSAVTVTAPTFSGALSGNAATATTLQTARTINGVSFNGSANITVTANTTNTLTRGSYLTGSNFNGSAATTWAVDATSANTASKVVARDASGNFSAGTITAALSGNATTATTLATARTINGTSFNGSANITTANWGTARTLTIGSTGKSVNGSGNVSWSLGEIGAAGAGAGGAIIENSNTISANYTITTGKNGMSAGPITIASGVTVTVPSGSAWSIV